MQVIYDCDDINHSLSLELTATELLATKQFGNPSPRTHLAIDLVFQCSKYMAYCTHFKLFNFIVIHSHVHNRISPDVQEGVMAKQLKIKYLLKTLKLQSVFSCYKKFVLRSLASLYN